MIAANHREPEHREPPDLRLYLRAGDGNRPALSAWELASHACPATDFAGQGLFALPVDDRYRPSENLASGTQQARCTHETIWMHTIGAVLVAITGAARYVCRYLPTAAVVRIGWYFAADRGEQEQASISTASSQVMHPASTRSASAGARPATRERRERKVRRCSWIS
jgi:hypothetical protein